MPDTTLNHGTDTHAASPELAAPFEMANLRPATTGLPFVVFVSQRGGVRHGPRIRISPLPRYDPAQAATVTLQHPPQVVGTITAFDLALVTAWIELNRTVIEAYWNGEIEYTEDMVDQIQPI